jgi:methyltransferase (TIGR00027 family)
MTAVVRGLHRQEPPPLVLDDSLAMPLAGEAGISMRELLQAAVDHDDLMAFSRWVCVRSRVAEDVIEQQARVGVDQYVILGAGLDTFAYRGSHPDLRVYEVDHQATQAWKRQRLVELGMATPANLVFVEIDFERQGLRDVLKESGFEFERRAVFSWLGVTMYLTRDAISQTLATIALGAAGTRVVLTYNQPNRMLDDHAVRLTSVLQPIAAGFAEPFVTFFTSEEIDELLRAHGFDGMEHVGREEARTRYFDGKLSIDIAGAQAVVCAVVGRTNR